MNQEIKQLWIEALLGEYKQGRGCLRSPGDEFCCLGVLCDLHSKATQTPWNPNHTYSSLKILYLDELSILPTKVQEWAGLDSPNPSIKTRTLGECNDAGMTFSEIATLIKDNL